MPWWAARAHSVSAHTFPAALAARAGERCGCENISRNNSGLVEISQLDTMQTITHYKHTINANLSRYLSIGATYAAALTMLSLTLFGANRYTQHNLVSDIPGTADQTDPNLVNPWGISTSPTSPFWISNNHSGVAGLYNGQGQPFPAGNALVVKIPVPQGGTPPAAPTGQVFNDTTGFSVSGKPALFIFASEDGTISGWSPSADATNAIVLVDNSASGAVYKGLALANTSNGPMLFAANFNSGTVDVFDANVTPVNTPGGFADTTLPAGFAPFNVQRIGRKLYVTYAMQDDAKHDDVQGPGHGFINVFDFNGNLIERLVSNGPLNSPWGMTLAPANFGDFSNALLVGNFGDGTINAFDPCSGEFLGNLQDANGAALSIPGLWALIFGNGKGAGDATTLYITAGIPGSGNLEDHGLFASIQVADAATAPKPQNAPVDISNFAFAPPTITVAAGTPIVWTNKDATAHTVTSDTRQFDSPVLDVSDTFSQTFTTPGTYTYHCSIHPFMKGKIVVQ